MKKKTSWVKVMAIITAIVGIAVAITGFIKKKTKRLSDELDFDNSLYFDDDAPMLTEDDVQQEEDGPETIDDLNALDTDEEIPVNEVE